MSVPRRAARTPGLYALDPEVKALLNIETFKKQFHTKEFIESMSESLILQAQQSDAMRTEGSSIKVFDPKPFIRTFEHVLEELYELRKDIKSRCADLEAETQLAEGAHRKKVGDLTRGFEEISSSFESLEGRISEVGNTAIRIGEQLENVDKQRARAANGKDLIEYFIEFAKTGRSERLEDLRDSGGLEGQQKAAIIARRLSAVVKETEDLDITAKSGIEQFSEDLEKDLLQNFDQAYRNGDARTMAYCAKVLHEFNGGNSCVQIYVNQHELFLSSMSMNEDEVRHSMDDHGLKDALGPAPPVDMSLVRLYEEIRTTIKREADIISAVFPNAAAVMQIFLQRLFVQTIQTHIESLLEHASSLSHLAYLRTLASTHAETARLVQDVKTYCENEVRFSQPIVGLDGTTTSSGVNLNIVLDRCMDDVFVPYTEGNRYVDREKKVLADSFDDLMAGFLVAQQQRGKIKPKGPSVFARTLNQISANSTTPAGNTSTGSPRSSFDNSGIYSNANHANSRGELILREMEEDGSVLSSEIIVKMFGVHAEAIKRAIELSSPTELARIIHVLFNVLIDQLGAKYIETALDNSMEPIDTKAEPDLKAFIVIRSANDIIHLIQQHFETAILPIVSSTPTLHRDIIIDKNTFMSSVEHKINIAIQREIDSIANWLSMLLSRQKKNDFRTQDEDALTSLATQPCNQCVDFLKKMNAFVEKYLDDKNFELFLTEVGFTFHAMLLEHFKKFYVSASGALVMTKDFAKYQETIHAFKISALNDRFEMLRQLGNVFLVRPEILKSILSEGWLARIDQKHLHPYLHMRLDYKSAKIDQMLGFQDLDTAMSGGSAVGSKSSLKGERRRLSTMREMLKKYADSSRQGMKDYTR